MAKDFKKFESEYDAIVKKVDAQESVLASNTNDRKQLMDGFDTYGAELAKRIKGLKASGMSGKKISDFDGDSAVKKLCDAMKGIDGSIKKRYENQVAAVAAIKALHGDMKELKKEIDKEANSRSSITSRSKKDMDALSKKVDKQAGKIETLSKSKYLYKAQADGHIEGAVDETAGIVAAAEAREEEESLTQALHARHIKVTAKNAKDLQGQIAKICGKVHELLDAAASSGDGATTAREQATKLTSLADQHYASLRATTVKIAKALKQEEELVKKSKDGKAINKSAQAIFVAHKQAENDLTKAKSALG